MSIGELSPGTSATVVDVRAGGALRQRLLDLGLRPDASVRVKRVAGAGGPVWVELRGAQLALRRREADCIVVSD